MLFLWIKRRRENGKMVEISSYIDLLERLKSDSFIHYFNRSKLLLPKKTDLSYYNWNTGLSISNDTKNFKIEADIENR